MSITELSEQTIEDLCTALEKVPTLDWKVLMTRWFRSLYSEDDVAIIERSKGVRPAKALLHDLDYRGITLRDLVEGLEGIRNIKAASIVKKGGSRFFFFPFFFIMYSFLLCINYERDVNKISEIRSS